MSKRFALVVAFALALGASALVSTDAWAPPDSGCPNCPAGIGG